MGISRILKRRDVTPDRWIIWIEKPRAYAFEAGQYCTIGRDGVEDIYSIVSAPHEGSLELFLKLEPPPDAILPTKLWSARAGDALTIRQTARGNFTFDPALPRKLLVATGTGVSPFVSYIRDYLHNRHDGQHFHVLHGVSYHDEFGYEAELERLGRERPDLVTYVPTVSRPHEERNEGWRGQTGRVSELVERHIDRFALTPGDTAVYACGNGGMIEDLKSRIGPRGFTVQLDRPQKQG